MEKVVIVSGFRTAIGKFGGTIKDIEASDLCAPTIRKNLDYTGINSKNIDEVIIGCVGQIAENYLISRMCTLKSGLPVEVPSLTVNRVCGSGLEAINLASLKRPSFTSSQNRQMTTYRPLPYLKKAPVIMLKETTWKKAGSRMPKAPKIGVPESNILSWMPKKRVK